MEKREKNNKALVLFSGGQDSTTCLLWALHNYEEVHAIGFDYGQRHAQELKQAAKIAAKFSVPYTIVDVKGIFIGGSLVNHSESLNEVREQDDSLPSSFTAGRNILFLSIAGSHAYDKGIRNLVTGVCQTDYSGYPDCRNTFIQSMHSSLNLGLGTSDMMIHTPLMWLTKAESWKFAKALGDELEVDAVKLIVEETLTDYSGDMTLNEWGRGKEDNPASVLRAKGFREAKANGWL